jgi:hypothetical protein
LKIDLTFPQSIVFWLTFPAKELRILETMRERNAQTNAQGSSSRRSQNHPPRSHDLPTRRRSKIAQLPKSLRHEINLLIEDNVPQKQILEFLAQRGHTGISHRNLSSWICGAKPNPGSSGFNDWRQEQQAISTLQAQQEFSLDLLRQNEGHSIHDAARLLAASQLAQVISDFDVQSLKEALSDHPEDYARVVNALTKLSRDNLEYEKYRFLVAEQKRKMEAALVKAQSGGLTPETIHAMEEVLDLF